MHDTCTGDPGESVVLPVYTLGSGEGVNGMHQCFLLVPDSHYCLNYQDFNDIMHLPNVGFPLLPLPHYVGGLMKIVVSDRTAHNFRVQLEFLIDGMDIDKEWCDNYLDEPASSRHKSKL